MIYVIRIHRSRMNRHCFDSGASSSHFFCIENICQLALVVPLFGIEYGLGYAI